MSSSSHSSSPSVLHDRVEFMKFVSSLPKVFEHFHEASSSRLLELLEFTPFISYVSHFSHLTSGSEFMNLPIGKVHNIFQDLPKDTLKSIVYQVCAFIAALDVAHEKVCKPSHVLTFASSEELTHLKGLSKRFHHNDLTSLILLIKLRLLPSNIVMLQPNQLLSHLLEVKAGESFASIIDISMKIVKMLEDEKHTSTTTTTTTINTTTPTSTPLKVSSSSSPCSNPVGCADFSELIHRPELFSKFDHTSTSSKLVEFLRTTDLSSYASRFSHLNGSQFLCLTIGEIHSMFEDLPNSETKHVVNEVCLSLLSIGFIQPEIVDSQPSPTHVLTFASIDDIKLLKRFLKRFNNHHDDDVNDLKKSLLGLIHLKLIPWNIIQLQPYQFASYLYEVRSMISMSSFLDVTFIILKMLKEEQHPYGFQIYDKVKEQSQQQQLTMNDTSHAHEKDIFERKETKAFPVAKSSSSSKTAPPKLSPPSATSIAGPFILTRDESDELMRLMTHLSPPSVDHPPPPADVSSFSSSRLLQLLKDTPTLRFYAPRFSHLTGRQFMNLTIGEIHTMFEDLIDVTHPKHDSRNIDSFEDIFRELCRFISSLELASKESIKPSHALTLASTEELTQLKGVSKHFKGSDLKNLILIIKLKLLPSNVVSLRPNQLMAHLLTIDSGNAILMIIDISVKVVRLMSSKKEMKQPLPPSTQKQQPSQLATPHNEKAETKKDGNEKAETKSPAASSPAPAPASSTSSPSSTTTTLVPNPNTINLPIIKLSKKVRDLSFNGLSIGQIRPFVEPFYGFRHATREQISSILSLAPDKNVRIVFDKLKFRDAAHFIDTPISALARLAEQHAPEQSRIGDGLLAFIILFMIADLVASGESRASLSVSTSLDVSTSPTDPCGLVFDTLLPASLRDAIGDHGIRLARCLGLCPEEILALSVHDVYRRLKFKHPAATIFDATLLVSTSSDIMRRTKSSLDILLKNIETKSSDELQHDLLSIDPKSCDTLLRSKLTGLQFLRMSPESIIQLVMDDVSKSDGGRLVALAARVSTYRRVSEAELNRDRSTYKTKEKEKKNKKKNQSSPSIVHGDAADDSDSDGGDGDGDPNDDLHKPDAASSASSSSTPSYSYQSKMIPFTDSMITEAGESLNQMNTSLISCMQIVQRNVHFGPNQSLDEVHTFDAPSMGTFLRHTSLAPISPRFDGLNGQEWLDLTVGTMRRLLRQCVDKGPVLSSFLQHCFIHVFITRTIIVDAINDAAAKSGRSGYTPSTNSSTQELNAALHRSSALVADGRLSDVPIELISRLALNLRPDQFIFGLPEPARPVRMPIPYKCIKSIVALSLLAFPGDTPDTSSIYMTQLSVLLGSIVTSRSNSSNTDSTKTIAESTSNATVIDGSNRRSESSKDKNGASIVGVAKPYTLPPIQCSDLPPNANEFTKGLTPEAVDLIQIIQNDAFIRSNQAIGKVHTFDARTLAAFLLDTSLAPIASLWDGLTGQEWLDLSNESIVHQLTSQSAFDGYGSNTWFVHMILIRLLIVTTKAGSGGYKPKYNPSTKTASYALKLLGCSIRHDYVSDILPLRPDQCIYNEETHDSPSLPITFSHAPRILALAMVLFPDAVNTNTNTRPDSTSAPTAAIKEDRGGVGMKSCQDKKGRTPQRTDAKRHTMPPIEYNEVTSPGDAAVKGMTLQAVELIRSMQDQVFIDGNQSIDQVHTFDAPTLMSFLRDTSLSPIASRFDGLTGQQWLDLSTEAIINRLTSKPRLSCSSALSWFVHMFLVRVMILTSVTSKSGGGGVYQPKYNPSITPMLDLHKHNHYPGHAKCFLLVAPLRPDQYVYEMTEHGRVSPSLPITAKQALSIVTLARFTCSDEPMGPNNEIETTQQEKKETCVNSAPITVAKRYTLPPIQPSELPPGATDSMRLVTQRAVDLIQTMECDAFIGPNQPIDNVHTLDARAMASFLRDSSLAMIASRFDGLTGQQWLDLSNQAIKSRLTHSSLSCRSAFAWFVHLFLIRMMIVTAKPMSGGYKPKYNPSSNHVKQLSFTSEITSVDYLPLRPDQCIYELHAGPHESPSLPVTFPVAREIFLLAMTIFPELFDLNANATSALAVAIDQDRSDRVKKGGTSQRTNAKPYTLPPVKYSEMPPAIDDFTKSVTLQAIQMIESMQHLVFVGGTQPIDKVHTLDAPTLMSFLRDTSLSPIASRFDGITGQQWLDLSTEAIVTRLTSKPLLSISSTISWFTHLFLLRTLIVTSHVGDVGYKPQYNPSSKGLTEELCLPDDRKSHDFTSNVLALRPDQFIFELPKHLREPPSLPITLPHASKLFRLLTIAIPTTTAMTHTDTGTTDNRSTTTGVKEMSHTKPVARTNRNKKKRDKKKKQKKQSTQTTPAPDITGQKDDDDDDDDDEDDESSVNGDGAVSDSCASASTNAGSSANAVSTSSPACKPIVDTDVTPSQNRDVTVGMAETSSTATISDKRIDSTTVVKSQTTSKESLHGSASASASSSSSSSSSSHAIAAGSAVNRVEPDDDTCLPVDQPSPTSSSIRTAKSKSADRSSVGATRLRRTPSASTYGPASQWNIMRVSLFLGSHCGMAKLVGAFREQKINGIKLLAMSKEDITHLCDAHQIEVTTEEIDSLHAAIGGLKESSSQAQDTQADQSEQVDATKVNQPDTSRPTDETATLTRSKATIAITPPATTSAVEAEPPNSTPATATSTSSPAAPSIATTSSSPTPAITSSQASSDPLEYPFLPSLLRCIVSESPHPDEQADALRVLSTCTHLNLSFILNRRRDVFEHIIRIIEIGHTRLDARDSAVLVLHLFNDFISYDILSPLASRCLSALLDYLKTTNPVDHLNHVKVAWKVIARFTCLGTFTAYVSEFANRRRILSACIDCHFDPRLMPLTIGKIIQESTSTINDVALLRLSLQMFPLLSRFLQIRSTSEEIVAMITLRIVKNIFRMIIKLIPQTNSKERDRMFQLALDARLHDRLFWHLTHVTSSDADLELADELLPCIFALYNGTSATMRQSMFDSSFIFAFERLSSETDRRIHQPMRTKQAQVVFKAIKATTKAKSSERKKIESHDTQHTT